MDEKSYKIYMEITSVRSFASILHTLMKCCLDNQISVVTCDMQPNDPPEIPKIQSV